MSNTKVKLKFHYQLSPETVGYISGDKLWLCHVLLMLILMLLLVLLLLLLLLLPPPPPPPPPPTIIGRYQVEIKRLKSVKMTSSPHAVS
jgi:hypothetical protein